MASLYQAVDIAVLPSYHEGIPVFLQEAAACGLPLVGSNIAGCREVIDPGRNGFLVPPQNVDVLTRAVLKLIEDKKLRRKMGRQSRLIAEERFNQEKIIREYLTLYNNLDVISR